MLRDVFHESDRSELAIERRDMQLLTAERRVRVFVNRIGVRTHETERDQKGDKKSKSYALQWVVD